MTHISPFSTLVAAAFAAAFISPVMGLAQDFQVQDPPLNVQDWDSLPDDQGAQPPDTRPAETQPPGANQGEQQNQDAITEKPAPEPKVERVSNPIAEFTGLDKITGRIITFDAYINETVQFGALQVTPRVCYSRPEAEVAKTDSFVEVDEITLDRKIRRIFTGWMFAQSPGLNAVEHPVYDVWLKDCKQKSKVPPPTSAKASGGAPASTTVNEDASKAD